jgi:hypothetical protein
LTTEIEKGNKSAPTAQTDTIGIAGPQDCDEKKRLLREISDDPKSSPKL